MPLKRNPENRGLPARWVVKHGAYYYMPHPDVRDRWDGKAWFRLGTSLTEAYQSWTARMEADEPTSLIDRIQTIGHLLDRYALEVVPGKSPKTRALNERCLVALKKVFGDVLIGQLEPQHVYRYADQRGRKKKGENGKISGGKVIAHREIEVLSHAYTKAVEWGIIRSHPFRGEVRLEGEVARDRYVEDWELIAALSLKSKMKKGSVTMIQAYLRLKLLTGLRQGDLLRLTASNVLDDGLHVTPRKTAKSTGKKIIYEWTPELKQAIENARASRPALSPYLFCNRKGECYVNPESDEARGWKSMWQRFMDRVLQETDVKERFTEHDLRAKVASDAESLERAKQLLAHADSRLTERVYRRKPERIMPAAGAANG